MITVRAFAQSRHGGFLIVEYRLWGAGLVELWYVNSVVVAFRL